MLTELEKTQWYAELEKQEIVGILTDTNEYVCPMCFALHHTNFDNFVRYVAQGNQVVAYNHVEAIVIYGDDYYEYMEVNEDEDTWGIEENICCQYCHEEIVAYKGEQE